jgi:DNA gyrase subunit A
LVYSNQTSKVYKMKLNRPDIDNVPPEVRAYIEALELELENLQRSNNGASRRAGRPSSVVEQDSLLEHYEEIEPTEPPTTLNVITATASGLAKRTPRHLYTRQNRGGMGIFDLDCPDEQPPAILAIADECQSVLIITQMGRAFRQPVSAIPEAPIRSRGTSIVTKLNLPDDERLAVIIPEQAQGYLALASQNGMVRMLRHHVFGEYMKPGTALYDYRSFGPLASACWTSGEHELFMVTQQGRAIRFSEKQIPPQGILGIRLTDQDAVVSVTEVRPDSGVFMLGSDGKGTIRLMDGFSANKSPGAGGKIAINADHLIFAASTDELREVFIISQLSKIIRFRLEQIPAKEGVVQGVVCMSLRADEPVAAVLT